jgi:hypothetical protein
MLGIEPAREPLDNKTFNKHYDHLYLYGKLNPEIIEQCDSYQQNALNHLKKCQARIKYPDDEEAQNKYLDL